VRRSTGAPPPSSKPGDKVTEQEFSPEKFISLTDCPGEPGCPALILLDETTLDNTFDHAHLSRRRVVKLFTQAGVDGFADLDFRQSGDAWTVPTLTGRTLLPDGTSIAIGKENIMLKTERLPGYVRNRRTSVKVPGVVPGTIIDCSWTEVSAVVGNVSELTWPVQHEIPVMKSVLIIRQGEMGYTGLPAGLQQFKIAASTGTGIGRYEVAAVPSLPREPLSPPFELLRFRVEFFQPERAKDWLGELAGVLAGQANFFMEKSPGVAAAVSRLVQPADPPQTRMEKIYRYVQEKIGTEEQRAEAAAERKEGSVVNADEVLARGYGDSRQRTLLFLAMAKAAGLEVSLLAVATRDNAILDVRLPDVSQFDDYAAAVKVGEGWAYFDPGCRHCPISRVAPEKEGVVANALLIVPRKGAGRGRNVQIGRMLYAATEVEPYKLVSIPMTPAARHVLSREARLRVAEDHGLEVDVSETGTGLADLDIRRRFESLGEDERRAAVREALPGEMAELASWSLDGLDAFDHPAVLRYKYAIPEFLTVLPDRMILTPSLFEAARPIPFGAETRQAPVVFPHARKTQDRIIVKLPDGYAAPVLPERLEIRDGPFHLVTFFSRELDTIVFTRILEIDAIVWPADGYARLREFFMKVQEADRQELVLARR